MKFLIQPMPYELNNDCSGFCEEYCYYKVCTDWCDNYCGDYDPCPGYSCGGYSTRSVGQQQNRLGA